MGWGRVKAALRVLGVSGDFAFSLGGGGYPYHMLMASIFGLAFILLLGLSMHIPTKALAGFSPLPPLSTNLLFGLSSFICTLWVTFLFNLTIHKSLFAWVVVLALINLGSILYLKVQQSSEPVAYKFGVRGFLIVSTASALSIFPQTGLSMSANLRSRIGPDMIGWVSSGKYLYNHSNLDDLKNSIRLGLNISDISQIFEESQKVLKHHVYNLLSFTDQVNAEFLIGAKRIIGPRIFSAAMVALGEYRLPLVVTTVTFIFTAIGLVFVIDTLDNFKKFALKDLPAITLFLLIAGNFAFQNPLNEGGIGQIFVFPSLCLLILSYLRNVFVLESIVLFLLSARLLYAESGSQLLVIIGIVLLFGKIPERFSKVSKKERVYLFSLVSIVLYSIGSYFLEVIGLTKTVSGGAGGWGIGDTISPLNFGLVNYVDTDGKSSPHQLLAIILVLVFISIYLLFIEKSINTWSVLFSRESRLIFGLFISWLFLSFLTSGSENNYALWKFAAFASVIILLITFKGINTIFESGTQRDLKKKFFFVFLILIIPTSQTIQYHSKWMSGSDKLVYLNMSKKELLSIEKLLDQSVVIKFGNFSHTNTLALFGNLKWPERGANIVQPSKNLQRLLIVEAEHCAPYKSAKEILLVTKELCFLDAASPSIKLNP